MKKFFKSKKWIAFFLALLLVVSTSITSSDAFLWATGVQEEDQVNTPAEDKETGELVQQVINIPETDQPAEDVQTPPTGEPQTPVTGEPQTPGTGEPQTPVTGEPQTPVTGEPQTPVTGDQQTPVTGDQQTPGTGDQQTPSTGDQLIEEEGVLDEENAMDFALFGARPLEDKGTTDKGTVTMNVGAKPTLEGPNGYKDYTWTEDARLTRTGSGQSVTIASNKTVENAAVKCTASRDETRWAFFIPYTVTVKETYTWKVTVNPTVYNATDTTNVYGSLNITGIDGAESAKVAGDIIKTYAVNKDAAPANDSWYDLGSKSVGSLPGITYTVYEVDNEGTVVNGIFSPDSEPDTDAVKGKFDDKLLDMASNIELKPENGAGSYVPVVADNGQLTWHFDVHVDVSNMNYTINYIDTKGNTIKDSSGKIWEKHGTVISGENVAPTIPGYQYVEDPANSIIIDKGKKNQVLTLTYEPMEVKYNVAFYYKKGEGDTAAYPSSPDKTEERKGLTATEASVTEEDTSKTGYVLDENAGNILSAPINGNGTTVLKVYLKPETDKSYTVHYYREDTKESVMDDKVVTGRTFGETYTENAVEVKGYTPVAPTSQTIKIDADNKELTFFYKADPATIKFETNGGTAVSDRTGVTAQEITDKAMPETKQEGYQFDGWYANPGFTGAKVTALPDKYPAGTTIYYAKWLKTSEYTIKYYYQQPLDGTYVERPSETKKDVVVGTQIDLSGVEAAEQPTIGRYVLNDAMGTLSGTVKEDGSLVLEVYFKLEYKVHAIIENGNGSVSSAPNREKTVWVPYDGNVANGEITFSADTGYIIESVTTSLAPNLSTPVETVSPKGEDAKNYIYAGRNGIRTNVEIKAKTKALSPALSLAKTTANASDNTAFVPGEEIVYTIVVENTGDQPLTNIEVKDGKTGFNQTIPGPLAPGGSETFTTTYTVKSEDVNGNGGKVENTVTATADVSGSYADDFPDGVTAVKKVTSLVEVSEPSIAVEIEAEDKAYEWDETVTYKITVTNNGNATIKDIKVTGTLPDLDWEVGTLVPDAEKFWIIKKSVDDKTVDYKVTSADILAGKIYNSVHVSGKDPMDTTVGDDDDVTVRTADIDASYSITKSLKDYDAGKEYAAGETLTYKITVTNKGNVTLDNIVVTDQLSNTVEGTVKFTKLGGISVDDTDALEVAGLTLNEDNTVTIESLEAKEDLELECEYEITKADAALNTQLDSADAGIKNTAAATADKVKPTTSDNDPVDPTGNPGESEAAKTEARYTLIVQYQYSNGTAVREPHIDYLKAGETYVAPVPAIAGYNSNYAAVTGTMEAKDLVITVVYSVPAATGGGEDTPTTPPTPPTPPAPTVVPDIPVPAGAIQAVVPVELTEIGDEEVPLQGARIDIDEDGNAEVVPIEEEEIPLAGMPEILRHCILHFLLLLAAVLMFVYHMVSTQRRQRKLDDMRDQLSGR